MKKKTLIMLLCAVMIVTSAAFGTIAYLTDRASVTNKFTIGNVDIRVDETKVDENGEPVPDSEHPGENQRTEEGNNYPLTPGANFVKDPTMTITKGSKDAYVRMMVTISKAAELKQIFSDLQNMYPGEFVNGFLPQEHVEGWDESVWLCNSMTEDMAANTINLEFRYKEVVASNEEADTTLPALFTNIKVPGKITYAQMQTIADLSIEVTGHAIQVTGFADVDEAWSAFDAQMGAEANLNQQP